MQPQELSGMIPVKPQNGQTATSYRIYLMAKACLGTSLVPKGDDPEYGCAISVSVLLNKAGIQITETVSTAQLLQELIASPYFTEVNVPQPGDVIIDATGTSRIVHTPIPNGHTGIVGYYGIMSNNSFDGLWEEKYDENSWRQRYEIKGGYRTRYFRAK